MARNQATKLWTAIVTAFLALCTALGLITTTATTAVARTEPTRNSSASHTTVPAPAPWLWSHARSLPPTMKQRIRAEAHGKSPSCRHRPTTETEAPESAPTTCDPLAPDEPPAALQH